MRFQSTAGSTFALLLLASACSTAFADEQRHPFDEYGVPDTITVEIRNTEHDQWLATVMLYNDENLAALTLPLHWRPKRGYFRLDSASYQGTRTEYFALKTFYPDTIAETILIGLISDLGTGLPPLEPGNGSIARLHFTALKNPPAPLTIDTTFIRPHNVLQMVTPDVRSILPAFQISHAHTAIKPTAESTDSASLPPDR